jgi:alpha-D-xyloside xylohydrolase
MFGKSIMVNPVTKPMYIKPASVNGRDTIYVEDFSVIKTKEVYLPAGSDWYDFWTGEKFTGGKKISIATPLEVIPLLVKAGSVIPMGPSVQYAEEKKWDDLDIRIYPGANGTFVLYEDEHDNYNYEKGVYSTIAFNWDDAKKALTINDRTGAFPGMLGSRTFRITTVNNTKGGQHSTAAQPDQVVTYTGKKIIVKL